MGRLPDLLRSCLGLSESLIYKPKDLVEPILSMFLVGCELLNSLGELLKHQALSSQFVVMSS